MRKYLPVLAVSALLALTAAGNAWAGEWIYLDTQNTWNYVKDDGSLAGGNEWVWIDGQCYCFDEFSALYKDTVTPDGYTVNADGAWVENGIVQRQGSQSASAHAERIATPYFTFQVPSGWEGKYTWRVYPETSSVAFYSRSNLAYGGYLFSIICRPDPDDQEFDAYGEITYIGAIQDSVTGAYTYLCLAGPTDVPFDHNDPVLTAEYLAMSEQKQDLTSTIQGIHGESLIYQGKAY